MLGLLIAILDIDEVIQVIRASDDAAQARARLIDVFDLSELQADYILELQLRRLTKFSRIELENERDKLQAEIAELETLLGDPARVRVRVGDELDEVAERFGTPRRTLLTEARTSIAATPAARKAAAASGPSLEIADVPTIVVLSTTGRAVRVDLPDGAERTRALGASQQARCDPVERRDDVARRARRGHLARATAALHAGRPAVGARELGAARRRRAHGRLPRHHRQEGARARAGVARVRPADRPRHGPGRREARRSRAATRRDPTSRSSR